MRAHGCNARCCCSVTPPSPQVARVTKAMVLQEMHVDAVRRTKKRMTMLCMKTPLSAWAELVVAPIRAKAAMAQQHYVHTLLRKCLNAWSEFYDDHMGAVKAKAQPRQRFQQRHNMNMVKAHARSLIMGKHLRAWWLYATRRAAAKRKFQGVADALVKRCLRAWHTRAAWQAKAKRLCLEQWIEHSRRLTSVPFRAWYLWSVEQKRQRMTQEVLLNAYSRRKRRMLLYSCFKSWAHRAIYGKIEGLHSRAELVQSLEDQKRHSAALEAALKSSRDTLKQAEEVRCCHAVCWPRE